MTKLNAEQEKILRKQIAVAQETIKECNKLLVDAGLQPEPESIIKDAKLLASGAVEQTGRGISSIVNKIKTGYRETMDNMRTAGEERQVKKEIDRQVEDQMKAVRDQLHHAVGVQK